MTSDVNRPASASGDLPTGSFRSRLDAPAWAELEALGRIQRFPAGTTLMFEGEPGDRVMVLLSGRVKIVRISVDGHERLLGFADAGDLVGEVSVFDGEPRVGAVIALEQVDALVIPADGFRRHLEISPRVAVIMLEMMSARFRETTIKRSQFGTSDTVGRLAGRLVELVERYGAPHDRGHIISLPLTQEELGSWAAGSPAGVAKALKTMREFGWIETERRRIVVLDLEALRRRAG